MLAAVVNEDVTNFYRYLLAFYKDKKVCELNTSVVTDFSVKDAIIKSVTIFKVIDNTLGPNIKELDDAIKKLLSKNTKSRYIHYGDIPNLARDFKYRDYISISDDILGLYFLIKFPNTKFLPHLQQEYIARDGLYDWDLYIEPLQEIDPPYPYESWEEAKETIQSYLELDNLFADAYNG